MLIDVSEQLSIGRNYRDASARLTLATEIAVSRPGPFADLPIAFWRDLVDTLSGIDDSIDGSTITTSFPLVLAERMVIAGESVDTLLADFVLEVRPYNASAAYPAPDQIATRCFDAEFLAIYRCAIEEVRRLAPGEEIGSIRVRLAPRRPENELFLQKLVLRGPSGGGALAAGLYAFHRGYKAIDRSLAVSFALTRPGRTQSDGCCHAVGGAYEKVRGCAKHGIRRLMVSEEQASQVAFYGHLQDVAILGVGAFADAVKLVDSAVASPPSLIQSMVVADDGGVLPLGSPVYVERASDMAFRDALSRRPMIVLVKGPRQIGKTSTLVRGVDHVRRSDVRLVYVDLQSMGRENLRTQKDLFCSLARVFTRELSLDVVMDDIYDDRDGPNKNLENFLFKHALRTPVIWFMDEVDRLFEFDYYADVFSLMRSWHNRRPIHSELGNLTLVLSYATETHLLIQDAYQSPFNVGVKVELADFTRDQIAALNERLGRPLLNDSAIDQFQFLAGGHPHLVCRGLSWMAYEHKSVSEFAASASLDNGPFGSHLRRLRIVAQNPELMSAIQDLLQGGCCTDNDAWLHLRSAGVVVGDDCSNVRIRCEIYTQYLRAHFLPRDKEAQLELHPRTSFWRNFWRPWK
ncbi:AAA-like domain-containing protein [Capsulimonas corticalis]|nr:AAA-like domain-containing protein [Capsulimonas corticalis]